MLRYQKTKVTNEQTPKRPIKIQNVNVDNIVT